MEGSQDGFITVTYNVWSTLKAVSGSFPQESQQDSMHRPKLLPLKGKEGHRKGGKREREREDDD